MIHHARDLTADQKRSIESLLGRPLSDNESVSIRALGAPPHVSAERRRAILASMEAHFAAIDSRRQNVTPAEADDIINEALRSTRPDYRAAR